MESAILVLQIAQQLDLVVPWNDGAKLPQSDTKSLKEKFVYVLLRARYVVTVATDTLRCFCTRDIASKVLLSIEYFNKYTCCFGIEIEWNGNRNYKVQNLGLREAGVFKHCWWFIPADLPSHWHIPVYIFITFDFSWNGLTLPAAAGCASSWKNHYFLVNKA